jgi:hypothetical protein
VTVSAPRTKEVAVDGSTVVMRQLYAGEWIDFTEARQKYIDAKDDAGLVKLAVETMQLVGFGVDALKMPPREALRMMGEIERFAWEDLPPAEQGKAGGP